MKLKGASYLDILKKRAGGSWSTVQATREASHDELKSQSMEQPGSDAVARIRLPLWLKVAMGWI